MSGREQKPKWMRVAEEWAASGQTQREFAARLGMPVGTLAGWVHRRKRRSGQEAAVAKSSRQGAEGGEPMRLLPVQVTQGVAPSASGFVEVVTPRGVRVHVAVGTAPEYVARLVAALG